MNVSVIIPFHNNRQSLALAIESALAQPETAEIILIDDGSTDTSSLIANQFLNDTKKVTLLTLDKNEGPSVARNYGIEKSAYPYIAFLDADDQYLPNRFRESKEIFLNHPDIDAVYGATQNFFLSAHLKNKYQSIYGYETDLIYLQSDGDPAHHFEMLALAKHGSIHLNALVVKRETLENLNGFDCTLRQMEDTDLILRLALKYKLLSISTRQPLARRNIHETNLIFSVQNKIDLRLLFLSKWITISLKERVPMKVILHFIRSYLGEHPYAGRGKFNVLKTWSRKIILLSNLIKICK